MKVTQIAEGGAVLSHQMNRPVCKCGASTGIHESVMADGTPLHPWGLTFGSGELDEFGYWSVPCKECARWHENQDGVPRNSYWPFDPKREGTKNVIEIIVDSHPDETWWKIKVRWEPRPCASPPIGSLWELADHHKFLRTLAMSSPMKQGRS